MEFFLTFEPFASLKVQTTWVCCYGEIVLKDWQNTEPECKELKFMLLNNTSVKCFLSFFIRKNEILHLVSSDLS